MTTKHAMKVTTRQTVEGAMKLNEAVRRALEETTLVKALVFIAIWETARVVNQARHSPTWDTCFERCFKDVIEAWAGQENSLALPRTYEPHR
jgi:heme A synthase